MKFFVAMKNSVSKLNFLFLNTFIISDEFSDKLYLATDLATENFVDKLKFIYFLFLFHFFIFFLFSNEISRR